MLADALLRSVAGTTALLRVTGTNTDTSMSEVGLVATTFAEVVVSPVVMRKLRPTWQEGGESKWELLVSATSVEQQVNALDLAVGAVSLCHDTGGYRGRAGLPDRIDRLQRSLRPGVSLSAAAARSAAAGGVTSQLQSQCIHNSSHRLTEL